MTDKITIERETLERQRFETWALLNHSMRDQEWFTESANDGTLADDLTDSWAAWRAALAAQPADAQQEPVAEVHAAHLRPYDGSGGHWCREVLLYSGNNPHDWLDGKNTRVKLYATPPPAAVPLTEEVLNIHKPYYSDIEWPCFKAGVRFAEMVHAIAAAGDKP